MTNQDLLDRIDERLRQKGLTDYRASMLAAGRPEIIRNIRRGRSRNPRRDTLEKLAQVLECSFEWLATGRGPVEPPAGDTLRDGEGVLQPGDTGLPPRREMPADVPVLGTAAGSLQGAFQLHAGEPIDHVRRPPGVATAVDIYAIYVVGDSMSPRFEDGELVYVSGRRPARSGDYVIVQIGAETEDVEAYCKRLVRRDGERLVLEQYNPARTFEVPASTVLAVHKVLTLNDLFGV